jgi:hypothetical protein
MLERPPTDSDFNNKKHKLSTNALRGKRNLSQFDEDFNDDLDDLDGNASKFLKKIKQTIIKTTKLKS